MPIFDTPEPITADIDLVVGDARVVASDRTDTVVDVRPSDAGSERDVRAAEQTRVEFAAGRLLVSAPKQRALSLLGKPGSVDVTVELPAGSDLRVTASVSGFRGQGRLGRCRIDTSSGDVQLDHTATLDVDTGIGTVDIGHVAGNAEIHTGSGRIRVVAVDGTAVVKNDNGQSWIGEVRGDLRISASNGDITVDDAGANVTATNANGDVRVGSVARGAASLKTSLGAVEIGIRNGTAAHLDVSTKFGRVINQLTSTEGPASTDETVDVYARTSYGDIVVRRS